MLDSFCHFTVTEKRQLTELITDLARMEKKDVKSIFQKQEFAGILEDRKLSRKDKGQKILQLLRRLCYPNLVRAEKIWASEVEKLKRPKDIWIPLARAMELSRLEDALECSSSRRVEGERWITEHKSALNNLLAQISKSVLEPKF